MSASGTRKDEQALAKARVEKLAANLIARRNCYITAAILLIALSVGIAFTGLWMVALASCVLGLIFLSQYFDANGSLHEVRRRPTKTIVPDFSVLRRTEGESRPQKAGGQPNAE